jgi:hypothetical protein
LGITLKFQENALNFGALKVGFVCDDSELILYYVARMILCWGNAGMFASVPQNV